MTRMPVTTESGIPDFRSVDGLWPDSYAGMLTSILMSCTETIFCTMSVYFLAAKVTKTRYTLPGALLATLAGTVASIFLAGKM